MLYYFDGKKAFTKRIRLGIILIPIPLFYLIQSIVLFGGSHFSKEDKAAGEYLSSIILQNPDTKILLDASDWNYLHVQVASQHPEKFIFNSGHNLTEPVNPIITNNGNVRISALENLRVKYLILQNPLVKKTITRRQEFTKIRSFGVWKLYKFDYKQ
jgi:hypothetical protein